MTSTMKTIAPLVAALLCGTAPALGQEAGQPEAPETRPEARPETRPETQEGAQEGVMTAAHLHELVTQLDDAAELTPRGARFKVRELPVTLVFDETHDRMRLLVPIRKAADLSPADFKRLMQANFDAALDARYALAQGILWSAYIHPLSALHDQQFVSGVAQTVTLALTFGTSYTSGALVFGGGDTGELHRQLLEELQTPADDI